MPFYAQTPSLAAWAGTAVADAAAHAGAAPDEVSLTVLLYDRPPRLSSRAPVLGAGLRGDRPTYPASVVKLFYMAAMMAWAESGFLIPTDEDRRAIDAMIRISSNNATSYVVDRLTGAGDGADLPDDAYAVWRHRREAVQRWISAWDWPEFAGCRVLHKTYDEGPYGLEARYRRETGSNLLTTDLTARLVHAIAAEELVTPDRCAEMLGYMNRDRERVGEARDVTENQVKGFLVEAMPPEARVWSKAGWTSETRHDALYAELADGRAITVVAFTTGRHLAQSETMLPTLSRLLLERIPAPADIGRT